MKRTNFIFIITLPLMWIFYCLFELFTQRLLLPNFFILTIIPSLILTLMSYLLFKLFITFKNGLSIKILLFLFFLLLFLDQGLKLIIKLFFFTKSFNIISNILWFNPIINTKGSWLNVRFNININFTILISINILALLLFTEIYRYYNSKNNKNIFADLSYLFIMIGSLCSLIDKIFYGGSLDFIAIGNLFIADFKDIYINLAIFMFILVIYNYDSTDKENIENKNDIENLKYFLKFIFNDFKSNIKKIKNLML
ncbi:MAG: signal peptidase II [Clostridium sp.]|nr:signal peptidase II [Clostridium sp.]